MKIKLALFALLAVLMSGITANEASAQRRGTVVQVQSSHHNTYRRHNYNRRRPAVIVRTPVVRTRVVVRDNHRPIRRHGRTNTVIIRH